MAFQGKRRGRQVLRPLPQGADGRRRLPDGRHPRPAADRDRRGPGPPHRAGPRTASSSRCSTASARTSRSGWPRQGQTVRVYVPYGDEWYGYLIRRLAERPANLAFFLRSLADQGLGRDCRWRRLRQTGRRPRRRQDGRGAAVRAAARPAGRRPTSLVTARRPERAERAARALRRRGRRPTPRRPPSADTLILAVKPQDMGALLDELGAARARRTGWSSRSRPASPTAFIEERLADGTPVVRVMSQHPGARRRGDERDLRRRARDRGAPRAHRGAASRRSARRSASPSRSRTRSPRCPAAARRTSSTWSRR